MRCDCAHCLTRPCCRRPPPPPSETTTATTTTTTTTTIPSRFHFKPPVQDTRAAGIPPDSVTPMTSPESLSAIEAAELISDLELASSHAPSHGYQMALQYRKGRDDTCRLGHALRRSTFNGGRECDVCCLPIQYNSTGLACDACTCALPLKTTLFLCIKHRCCTGTTCARAVQALAGLLSTCPLPSPVCSLLHAPVT